MRPGIPGPGSTGPQEVAVPMSVRVTAATVGDLDTLLPSFARSLRAANKAATTVEVYVGAARQLVDYLRAQGMPTKATEVTRDHIEAFLADLLERRRPATANNRYRALCQFFLFLVDYGELPDSPMAKMRPPKVPEVPVPVVS